MGQHKRTEHPALALMRHHAKGYLIRFQTDLDVHDVAALSQRPPTTAFGWILRPDATFMAFTSTQTDAVANWRNYPRQKFASNVVSAFGIDDCKFFFWDGSVLMQLRCASDLDSKIDSHERDLLAVCAADPADMGGR